MKSMKIKSIAMAGMLSLSMLAGMPVMAATAGTENMATAPTVDKTVNYAEGVTLPENTNIEFTVTKVENADGVAAPTDDGNDVAVTAATASNFTKSGKTANLKIKNLPTNVGEYTYFITEKALPNDNEYGWTNTSQKTEYFLHVLVKKGTDNNTTTEYFVTTTNTTATDDNGNKTYSDKVDSIAFTNKYTKKAAPLTITKKVSDTTYEPKDQEYTFKVTFETDNLNPSKEEYSYTKGEDTEAQTIKSEGTLTLKNGETATFDDIPAGTKVTVVETPVTNIKDVKIDVTSNGSSATTEKIDKGSVFTTGSVLIGEEQNAITFTNEYTDVTATGVVTNIAPYITMVVVAGAAIAVYVVLKKRLAR